MRKIIYLALSFASIVGGVLFYAITHNIIIIRYPPQSPIKNSRSSLDKELMRFTYFKGTTCAYEWRHIIQDDEDIVTAQRIITAYWAVIEDNGLLPARIQVQSTTTDRTGKILLCSLSDNPCSVEASTLTAWLLIEGLILTLRELMPQFQKILFLVNHELLTHPTLDFSRTWPIEGFSTAAQYTENYKKPSRAAAVSPLDRSLIVYINPAGSPYHPGRTIGDSFERGIALNCAQALKDELALRVPLTRVIINQAREENRDYVQHINHAHKVRANIYVHLSFYHTQKSTPELTLTSFRWHPTTDLWKRDVRKEDFIPFHEAHFTCASLTNIMSQHMFYYAATHRPFPLCATACLALPYAPLAGIAIPAIGIEIGIQHGKQVADIAPALADMVVKGLELLP